MFDLQSLLTRLFDHFKLFDHCLIICLKQHCTFYADYYTVIGYEVGESTTPTCRSMTSRCMTDTDRKGFFRFGNYKQSLQNSVFFSTLAIDTVVLACSHDHIC